MVRVYLGGGNRESSRLLGVYLVGHRPMLRIQVRGDALDGIGKREL